MLTSWLCIFFLALTSTINSALAFRQYKDEEMVAIKSGLADDLKTYLQESNDYAKKLSDANDKKIDMIEMPKSMLKAGIKVSSEEKNVFMKFVGRKYICIDWGGSSLKISVVRFIEDNNYKVIRSYSIDHDKTDRLPDLENIMTTNGAIDATKIFFRIAKALKHVLSFEECQNSFIIDDDTEWDISNIRRSTTIVPIGFTFSFPLYHLGPCEGYIVSMGKGVRDGTGDNQITGKDPVALLNAAMKDIGLDTENYVITSLINDSVAALLSARFMNPSKEVIGAIILGTGFNIALADSDEFYNSEMGGYNSPNLKRTIVDELVYSSSCKLDGGEEPTFYSPTPYATEKMFSGKFLGRILQQILEYHGSPLGHRLRGQLISLLDGKTFSSADVTYFQTFFGEFSQKCKGLSMAPSTSTNIQFPPMTMPKPVIDRLVSIFGHKLSFLNFISPEFVCTVLSSSNDIMVRSYQLMASIIAGIIYFVKENPDSRKTYYFAADGSVIIKHEEFIPKVEELLASVFKLKVKILDINSGSGFGAAVAAGLLADESYKN